jgi:transposase
VASFRRYVAANLPEETRRSQVRVLRPFPAEPGEAQIDYGQLGRWLDPPTGKRVVIWAFAMVLACSRHMFVRPVIRLDQHAWTECHLAAFSFFGAVPARLVPENGLYGLRQPSRCSCPVFSSAEGGAGCPPEGRRRLGCLVRRF